MIIPEIPIEKEFKLLSRGTWPETWHVFDKPSVDAILMAYVNERPLLVRGEPGSGKSQLARAAAQVLERAFISEVVHARTEPQDLQWRFDAIGRLGEAQALASRSVSKPGKRGDPLDPRRFLSPGPLWWAFDWHSASALHEASRYKLAKPAAPEGWSPEKGCVLLIDEIDKAESDVPNSLLETLGNGSFSVPWLRSSLVKTVAGMPKPLIIFTTNEDRELPAAFLRRCLVLDYDKDERELEKWLIRRGKVHFPDIDPEVLKKAAEELLVDRGRARSVGAAPPGQAEYLDLLKALQVLDKTADEQVRRLDDLKQFVYSKHRKAGHREA